MARELHLISVSGLEEKSRVDLFCLIMFMSTNYVFIKEVEEVRYTLSQL